MELNEIKKALYKQSPSAHFQKVTKSGLLYEACIRVDTDPNIAPKIQIIYFLIPFEEIGDATFEENEPAKLLIRYII